MSEYKQIEVESELFVPFKWRDDAPALSNLGRAEFGVCLKVLRGKLKEFWVYPFQQRLDEKIRWHCKANKYNDFNISSYEGLSSVGAWLIYPDEEHKSLMLCVYAPANSCYLKITPSGISFWINDYSDKPFTGISQILKRAFYTLGKEEPKELMEKLSQLDNKHENNSVNPHSQ